MTQNQAESLTALLEQWRQGNPGSADQVTPLIYAELRRLARCISSDEHRKNISLNPTALVHEAYLRLSRQNMPLWKNRSHFFSIASKLMRQILVDRARQHKAEKRGAGVKKIPLEQAQHLSSQPEPDWLALDKALLTLSARSPRKAEIVELRVFGGLTIEETAAYLEISQATVINDYRFAKGWLYRKLNQSCGLI